MYRIARCNRNPFAHDGSGSPLVEHRTLTVVFWHSRSRKRYLCCRKELAMTLSAIGEQAGSRNGDERQIREKACVAPVSRSSGQTILRPATLNLFFTVFTTFALCTTRGSSQKLLFAISLCGTYLVDDTGLEPVTLRTSSGCSSS